MSAKFRSVDAFKQFEQRRTLGGEAPAEGAVAEPAEELSPLRVLAVLKRHPAGLGRADLMSELQATERAVENACLRLVSEGLVRMEPGQKPGEERFIAS